MKEVLMFCEAYGEIQSCLYITKLNSEQNNPVTIVVLGNHDLFQFLTIVNERVFDRRINVMYFDVFRGANSKGSGIKKIFYHVMNIIKTRKYYRRLYTNHLDAFRGVDVYFFTRYYIHDNFYLLKRLSKNNTIIFMCVLDWEDKIGKYIPRTVYDLMSLIKLKLTYGFDMTMAELPHEKFPYISDSFIAKDVARVISEEETTELLRDFNFNEFNLFDIGHYSVMYFDQPLIASGRIGDTAVFIKEMNGIFAILGKYFLDKEIAIKYHPLLPANRTIIKTGTVLEDFIPAELLYNDNVKLYLSFSSGSLANVEKGLAVSLIDLVSFKDNQAKQFIKENLINRSHSEILFPQSLDEFESIIRNITRERAEG